MMHVLKLLLPALIPSWRFFDIIAPSPRIEFVRLKTPQEIPEHWQEFRPRPMHLSLLLMLQRLFWNPQWNESLFLVSCAERMLENPTAHSHQQILERLVADLAPVSATTPYVQFRLALISRQNAALVKEIAYISPVHAIAGEGP